MLNQISESRKISVDTLNAYADQMMMFQPTENQNNTHLLIRLFCWRGRMHSYFLCFWL